MNFPNCTWWAQTTNFARRVDLLAVREIGDQREIITTELTATFIDRNAYIEKPTLSMHPESAQSLMQALWDAGVRPAQWKGGEAEVRAMKSHLDFAQGMATSLLERVPTGKTGESK